MRAPHKTETGCHCVVKTGRPDLRGFMPAPGIIKLLSCLLLLIFTPAAALDPHRLISQYDIRLYTAKDGLPMNSVKKVFQDSRGFIWIGTQEGLVRFDGINF
ncbi:MAG TPA: hypothetical protein PKI90_14285, partial [bacterium]|nr:hypothetical protein [bacterium]